MFVLRTLGENLLRILNIYASLKGSLLLLWSILVNSIERIKSEIVMKVATKLNREVMTVNDDVIQSMFTKFYLCIDEKAALSDNCGYLLSRQRILTNKREISLGFIILLGWFLNVIEGFFKESQIFSKCLVMLCLSSVLSFLIVTTQ